ncbi:MAG: prefoldin subunit alpha [Methanophagales archaeon]|nr:prefoldin subunit alpha [Methanophagales archaeon]MCW3140870.1 prefoldin subunit alpha [Methanophagales archaeon]
MEERELTERRREQEQQAEVQSLILRLRQYQAQAETTSQELIFVRQAIGEHEKAIETIKQLKRMKAGDELIVPIGANSSVYATLSNTDKIIVRIGGGVSAEKDPDSSMEYLEEKKKELENSQREMTGVLQRMEQEAQKIQTRLQEIASAGSSGAGAGR